MSNGDPTATPMSLADGDQDWPIGSSMAALVRAAEAAEVQQAQAQLNGAQASSGHHLAGSSLANGHPQPTPQPHPTVVDQAALNHIINNPRLLELVTARIAAAQASHAVPPPETVTRSGRPSRPSADAQPVSISEIWANLAPGEFERILNDVTLASQSESYAFPAGSDFMLDPQLAVGGDGAQTFAPTPAPMDHDFWWNLQEEGEEDDPTYVPPSDSHTPAAHGSTPGVFTFSPAGDGEFLSSIGLNPDGTTPGVSAGGGQGTTSALYAAASPAATSLMELAASHSPGAFGRPSPGGGSARLHPSTAHGSAPSPSLIVSVPATSSAQPERSLRARKKVRVEEPVPSAAAAKGKGRARSVAGTSVGGTSAGGSGDEDAGTSPLAGAAAEAPKTVTGGKKRGRAPVLSKEESAARRSERNKASALASRLRAKKVVEDLEASVAELTAKVTMLEGELRATRHELLKAQSSRPSHAPNTLVYYNTPNIYDAGADGDAPEHPFAQLPPTPVKRKRGRPRKKKDEADPKSTAEAPFGAAPVTDKASAPLSSTTTTTTTTTAPGTVVDDKSPPRTGGPAIDEEEEAEFTDGNEGSSDDGDTEEDDPDDDDFVEGAPPSAAAVPSSPASQATVVPDGRDTGGLAPPPPQPPPTTATNGHPSSTPAGSHLPSTSDVSDTSGDEDDPSSDRDPDSDFDPTEDLYLPIRDVPHPGPPPDSPPRSAAGPSLAGLLASPARMQAGRPPGVPPSPLANVDKTEVVDLLKQLLAKMGGGAGGSAP